MGSKDDAQQFTEDWFNDCGQVVAKTFGDACDLVLAALTLGGQVHKETSIALEKLRNAAGFLPEDIARIDAKIAEAREGLFLIGAHIKMVDELREKLKKSLDLRGADVP